MRRQIAHERIELGGEVIVPHFVRQELSHGSDGLERRRGCGAAQAPRTAQAPLLATAASDRAHGARSPP
ncbi:MAG: hypothetical protein EOP84_05990 [Verrucomicrobiaceae bacterium]|nr:MAG: hypothetical protein EOP84_05990 [Verrucomicrobiaceae bacterium]